MIGAAVRPPPTRAGRRGWANRPPRLPDHRGPGGPRPRQRYPNIQREASDRLLDGLDHIAEPGHLFQNSFQWTDQAGHSLETVSSDGLFGESGIGRRLDRRRNGVVPLVSTHLHIGP